MKEVDELIERLNDAYTPESIFRRDVNSVIQRHAKEGQNWSILSSDIADGLTELGYIKVVLCRDCWKWGEDACPMATMGDDDDFCPYGEPKEDTNLSSVEEQMCQAKEDTNDTV